MMYHVKVSNCALQSSQFMQIVNLEFLTKEKNYLHVDQEICFKEKFQ